MHITCSARHALLVERIIWIYVYHFSWHVIFKLESDKPDIHVLALCSCLMPNKRSYVAQINNINTHSAFVYNLGAYKRNADYNVSNNHNVPLSSQAMWSRKQFAQCLLCWKRYTIVMLNCEITSAIRCRQTYNARLHNYVHVRICFAIDSTMFANVFQQKSIRLILCLMTDENMLRCVQKC